MVVVNIPIRFETVQPESAITVNMLIIPKYNPVTPMILGRIKSLWSIGTGYPSVVDIKILVIANTEIKEKQADRDENVNILLCHLECNSETTRLATMAIEKPPNKELITMDCSASLCKKLKERSGMRLFMSS